MVGIVAGARTQDFPQPTLFTALKPVGRLQDQESRAFAEIQSVGFGKRSAPGFAGGFESMNALLELPVPPQAIFAGNDAMAVGAYQAIFQKGMKVPDDISIVGYDDIDLSSYMIPPLTTIHQPKDELGQQAVSQLIYRMDNPEAETGVLVLTPELIERQSVKKVSS